MQLPSCSGCTVNAAGVSSGDPTTGEKVLLEGAKHNEEVMRDGLPNDLEISGEHPTERSEGGWSSAAFPC